MTLNCKLLLLAGAFSMSACSASGIKSTSFECDIDPIMNAQDVARHKQDCEARQGCRYVAPEPCYCPPATFCLCGGGEAPLCINE